MHEALFSVYLNIIRFFFPQLQAGAPEKQRALFELFLKMTSIGWQ